MIPPDEIIDIMCLSLTRSERDELKARITEFAEERVKEATQDQPTMSLFIHKRLLQEARNAALDEAAQLVSSYMYEKGLSVSLIDLAEQLRALKKSKML